MMEKEITIQEYNNFLSIQRKWDYYDNFKKYLKEHTEETFEYLCLHPDETGIKVDIAIDDEASFIKNNHPLWLYFDNGKHMENRIPVSISLNPQVLANEHINISRQTLSDIKNFIRRNYKALVEYGHGNMDVTEFYTLIKNENILSDSTLLCEMPILNKKLTGLNTPIWIDNVRNKQHGNRIKFKYDEDDNTNNWATMTISDQYPVVKNMNRQQKIPNKEIERIKQFVIYNYDILSALSSNNAMNYNTEFLPFIIKVGEHGGMILPQSRLSKTIQAQDEVVKIDCGFFNDSVYFFVKTRNENTEKLIDELCKNPIFKKYNAYGIYTPFSEIKMEQGYGHTLLDYIEDVAKKNNIQIKFINTNNII